MIENFIFENLNLFIKENNLSETYNNIKNFSKNYSVFYDLIFNEFNKVYSESESEYITDYILENEILDNVKSGTGLFFTNLKDVFFNAALSKKIGLTSAGISIGNLTTGYSLSNAVMPLFGMQATTVASTGVAANLATAGIFSISAFFLLLAGATIYKIIGTNSNVLVKTYEDYVKECISNLGRFNPTLLSLNKTSNIIYNKILDEKCSTIKDKKELLICGVKNYMELNSNLVLPEIYRAYYRYLTSKNIKLDHIQSAADLFYYKILKDTSSFFVNRIYDKYLEIFDNILKNDQEFKIKCIKNLNLKCAAIAKQELNNVK